MTLLRQLKSTYYLVRGWKHLHRGNYPRAVTLLEAAAAADPYDTSLPWLLLGHAHLGIKNVRPATIAYLRYYEIQKRTNPTKWTSWEESQFKEGMQRLADCLVWEGRRDDLARITKELDVMRRVARSTGETLDDRSN
jgi:tetratricopeptide (TPR) repeat protein